MEEVFAEFSKLMHFRLSKSVYTTEDSIRYTFFFALITQTSLRPHDVILECPHPQIKGAEIDTFISPLDAEGIMGSGLHSKKGIMGSGLHSTLLCTFFN